jgi:hypothetical protein
LAALLRVGARYEKWLGESQANGTPKKLLASGHDTPSLSLFFAIMPVAAQTQHAGMARMGMVETRMLRVQLYGN